MEQPNILFIVWDACRYDYAINHASFLNELGSSNLWFKNAIAPSPWSLPSHASMFTGDLPHKHGSYQFGDSVETPLVSRLSDRGYTTYGVSANGFASQRTGFHEDFDWFRYTGGRDLYLDGMDVSGTAQGVLHGSNGSHVKALFETLKTLSTHTSRAKSLGNLLAVSCGELATKLDPLQQIPHPVFAPTSDYSYRPEKNTRTIQSIFESHNADEPFFLFTNYMDAHRCYKPPDGVQTAHIGRQLGHDELIRLNEEIAAPWAFEEKKETDELDDSDIEDVRGLYAGEIETVDAHLRRIYDALETEGLLDNTIIIITADHGENLGETDQMGRRRMGHEASVSDAVLRVPLVIAHPDLNARTVSETISLKNLYELFVNPEPIIDSEGNKLPELVRDEPTVSQYPLKGGTKEMIEKYPDASPETIRFASSENSVVAYDAGWKVVAESTGEQWAREEFDETSFQDAPETLRNVTQNCLSVLSNRVNLNMSDGQVSQLEALGYI